MTRFCLNHGKVDGCTNPETAVLVHPALVPVLALHWCDTDSGDVWCTECVKPHPCPTFTAATEGATP